MYQELFNYLIILMEKQEQYFELIKKRVADFNKNFEPLVIF